MMLRNVELTIVPGYPMKVSVLRLALLATALVAPTAALAADLDPPPPIEDLRPATYDWTGLSIGVFGSANALDGHYDATPICGGGCGVLDPDMSGIGYGFGVRATGDVQMDMFVLGIVADWQFGGYLADNDDPAEATYMNMNHLGTLRARAGIADDNTLIYATGGVAMAEMEFGGAVGPAGVDDSDAQWTYGFAVGGGIEHAFSESVSVNLEYLYIGLQDTSHFLTDGAGSGGTIDMKYNDMHTIRAGLNYRFSL